MAKYDGWTLGETEALLNVVGGVEVARAVLRGERKLIVEVVPMPQAPARPPLVGRVVKTITVPAYAASDFAEAVRLGNFDNRDTLSNITRQFAKERVGLGKAVTVELVEFDRDWWSDEAIAWGKENGNKKPIVPAHLLGIAIKLPDEQRELTIVELGSVRDGLMLFLYDNSGRRCLGRETVKSRWPRHFLLGFVSQPA